MRSQLHTFVSVFSSDEQACDNMTIKRIRIPRIQRDYAQGRTGDDIHRVRKRFLDSLYRAVTEEPIMLDFVYGSMEDGDLVLLDGQQRLTTLFLLHWFAAKKDGIAKQEHDFLLKFSYDVRPSARDFCARLIDFNPQGLQSQDRDIAFEIQDQSWFPRSWKRDPTIASMLVMLSDIQKRFSDIDELWNRLVTGAVSFYLLPIENMGLTDSVYIKMNSRGKPLTRFEHFKAELEGYLRSIDEQTASRISFKIDGSWNDLLWIYHGEDGLVDDMFLRYFQFACDVICYMNGETLQGKSRDEFDLLERYFSVDAEGARNNVAVFEELFDCWVDLVKGSGGHVPLLPCDFLSGLITDGHEPGKISMSALDKGCGTDLSRDCLMNYASVRSGARLFTLPKFAMLYSLTFFLCNRDKIPQDDLPKRLRRINNLIRNSADELSDSESRQGGNRMPAIVQQIRSIMFHDHIDREIGPNFNRQQLLEEIGKKEWLVDHEEWEEALFELEDHPLLYGQISIVGLEDPSRFVKFAKLFACDLDTVDRALMALGAYPQRERNGWRYQFGSRSHDSAWDALFHKSTNEGFEETRRILNMLLDRSDGFSSEMLSEIADEYVAHCKQEARFGFRYYYIAYNCFRPGSYGKYWFSDLEGNPYDVKVLQTPSNISSSTYQPFLRVLGLFLEGRETRDPYIHRFYIADETYWEAESSAYVLYSSGEEGRRRECLRVDIPQTEDGIDIVDRIEFMREAVSRHSGRALPLG